MPKINNNHPRIADNSQNKEICPICKGNGYYWHRSTAFTCLECLKKLGEEQMGSKEAGA